MDWLRVMPGVASTLSSLFLLHTDTLPDSCRIKKTSRPAAGRRAASGECARYSDTEPTVWPSTRSTSSTSFGKASSTWSLTPR